MAPDMLCQAVVLPADDSKPARLATVRSHRALVDATKLLGADDGAATPGAQPVAVATRYGSAGGAAKLVLLAWRATTEGEPAVDGVTPTKNVRASQYARDGTSVHGTAVLVAVAPQRGFLFRLLRREAVSASDVPLSADAFSMWGGRDAMAVHHNARVRAATARVVEERVPALAQQLDAMAAQLTKNQAIVEAT